MADDIYSKHASVEATATTTEANTGFVCKKIAYLINDDETNNLIVNFDAATDANNKITLGPKEYIENMPRKCETLYYKSSASTVAFRAVGLN